MLDLTPDQWKHVSKTTVDEEKARARRVARAFEPFDWTKMLDQGTETAPTT